jgi:hypothetical protein
LLLLLLSFLLALLSSGLIFLPSLFAAATSSLSVSNITHAEKRGGNRQG